MSRSTGALPRNFVAVTLGQTGSRILLFLTTIHLTRALAAERFGVIAFATGVLLYAGILVDFGFEAFGAREVARRTTRLSELVGTVVALRVVLGVLAIGALALFVALVRLPDVTKTILMLYGLSLLTNAVNLQWVFLGLERMPATALAEFVGQAVLTVGVFLWVKGPGDLLCVPWLFLAGRVAAVALLWVLYLRSEETPSPSPARAGPLLKRATPFLGMTAVGQVSDNFDIVLLGFWLGARSTGLYGAAYRVVWIPTMLVMAYNTTVRPALARGSIDGFATVEKLVDHSMRRLAAFGVGVVVGGILLAEPLVLLLFGAEYRGAARPMQILLAAFGLIAVNRYFRTLLTTFDHERLSFWIMLSGAVVNIVGNVLLIPRYGLAGAATATLVSEAAISIVVYVCVRRLVEHVAVFRHLLRPAACGAVMALIIVATPTWPLPGRVAVATLAYLAMVVVLRVIAVEEIRGLLRFRER